MKTALIMISVAALITLLALPVLHAAGVVRDGMAQAGIWFGTVGWFATAPFWIGSDRKRDRGKTHG